MPCKGILRDVGEKVVLQVDDFHMFWRDQETTGKTEERITVNMVVVISCFQNLLSKQFFFISKIPFNYI